MRESENNNPFPAHDDDFDLEIVDLPDHIHPPSPLPAFLKRAGTRLFATRSRLLLVGSLALALLCASLLSNFSLFNDQVARFLPNLLFSHTAPSPTPAHTVISGVSDVQVQVIINGTPLTNSPPVDGMNPVPHSCPQGSHVHALDAPYEPTGIGESPLWITGMAGPIATLNHLTRARQPLLGWYQQVTLIYTIMYSGGITIQGGNQVTNIPLWLGDSANQHLGYSQTISPLDPTTFNHLGEDSQYVSQPLFIYVPAAGCYFLQVSWLGGMWTEFFAAGR